MSEEIVVNDEVEAKVETKPEVKPEAKPEYDKESINIITRLRAERRELTERLTNLESEYATTKNKLEEYSLKEVKSKLLRESLKDKQVADISKLEKWVTKLPNSENLEAEIRELVEDFAVTVPTAVPAEKEEKIEEPAKQPSINDILKKISIGTGTPTEAQPVKFDAKSPFDLLRLQTENPEAYEKWKNSR